MSKIHEALKRAEQEKEANAAAPRPAAPPLASPVPPVTEEPLPAEFLHLGRPAEAVRLAAEFIQPLSWDLVAASCQTRPWKPTKGMLFLDGNRHDQVGVEEFKTLRSRLYHMREKQPLKTILVASALPAEGKTFVSANLAQTLARQHGRRVVLLDCDLRRSRLHESLGTDSGPGVSEYLRGEANELPILQRGPMENLAFIPGGVHVSNPAELIGNGRLEMLVKRLADAFDWIVIDSSPVVPVSDATMIARCCDGILLVVDSGQTPFDLAQRARNEFRNMPVLGVVLNRVDPGSTYVSYYYGGYGKPGQNANDGDGPRGSRPQPSKSLTVDGGSGARATQLRK